MASYDLITFQSGRQKRQVTSSSTVDFLSVRIGASNLAIAEATGHFDFGAKRLTNLATPTAAADATTKAYVDAIAQGLDIKESVRLATAAALPTNTASGTGVGKTLTATANGALSVDGIAVANGNRVLVKNEATGANNGIYVVTDLGSGGTPYILTRTTDSDEGAEVDAGMFMFVAEGSTLADTGWVLVTNDPITVDTTALSFTQFTSAGAIVGGAGLLLTGNTLSVELATDPGLEFDAGGDGGKLRVLVNPAGAIERVTAGLGVKLEASSPSLQISANELGLKIDANGGLQKLAAGVSVKLADATLKSSSSGVAVDHAKSFVNDNAGSITIRQVVYVKANGAVDLAQATVASLADFELGLVEDATIATTASGKIGVRRGAIVSGFSGLTPGKEQYVSRATAGALTESLAGFLAGEFVYSVGRAISATEVLLDPHFILEY